MACGLVWSAVLLTLLASTGTAKSSSNSLSLASAPASVQASHRGARTAERAEQREPDQPERPQQPLASPDTAASNASSDEGLELTDTRQTDPTSESPASSPAELPAPDPSGALRQDGTASMLPEPEDNDVPERIWPLLVLAALQHDLPIDFFTRLIRKESRFNPRAVSPVGAQGIAQFMPRTAAGRGLQDPFDPAQALPEAAEFLSELRKRFGNLGLAAAAYNAGPKRVKDWLNRQITTLSRETQDYVRVITGQPLTEWVPADAAIANAGPAAKEPEPARTTAAAAKEPQPGPKKVAAMKAKSMTPASKKES
jgi:hypothetical protein